MTDEFEGVGSMLFYVNIYQFYKSFNPCTTGYAKGHAADKERFKWKFGRNAGSLRLQNIKAKRDAFAQRQATTK
jgi:hypothetical protein